MKNKQIIYLIPILLYSTILFILSNQSKNPDFINDNYGMDKLVHMIAYSIFALLLNIALITKIESIKKRVFMVLIIGLLFGISDEFHQSFVPGREASISDLIFDLLGVCLSLLIIYLKIDLKIIKLFFKNYGDWS